jgi:hypothetical protein
LIRFRGEVWRARRPPRDKKFSRNGEGKRAAVVFLRRAIESIDPPPTGMTAITRGQFVLRASRPASLPGLTGVATAMAVESPGVPRINVFAEARMGLRNTAAAKSSAGIERANAKFRSVVTESNFQSVSPDVEEAMAKLPRTPYRPGALKPPGFEVYTITPANRILKRTIITTS